MSSNRAKCGNFCADAREGTQTVRIGDYGPSGGRSLQVCAQLQMTDKSSCAGKVRCFANLVGADVLDSPFCASGIRDVQRSSPTGLCTAVYASWMPCREQICAYPRYVSRIAGDHPLASRAGSPPTGLCVAVYVSWMAGRRGRRPLRVCANNEINTSLLQTLGISLFSKPFAFFVVGDGASTSRVA